MQRIAIIGEGPAAYPPPRSLSALACVWTSLPSAPHHSVYFDALRVWPACWATPFQDPTAAPAPLRLRLIGNVRVGPDGDITQNEIHRLAASGNRELLVLELKARGVAVTTWEGLCAPLQDFEDWRSVITRAQLAHVGI